jgi:pimeloyl-ACP methyl ester carboxylesterase
MALYQHDRPAPLLFILPGFGANPYFGVSSYLAEVFYRAGFHVVVLPSPMSWNFALAASRTGVPGYAPADALDLYDVMQKTLATLRTEHDLTPDGIYLLGFSLGGLEGAYLSVIDEQERKVGIEKFLLIDPPVNAGHALEKISEWTRLGSKFGAEKSRDLIARAIGIADAFSYAPGDSPEIIDRFVRKFDIFSREEIQFLIAQNLQGQLAELVYVTQAIHDQNVLRSPKNEPRTRLEEAGTFSLTDYERKIALPLWRKRLNAPQTDAARLMRQGSIWRIVGWLRNNPRVHVMHNADDVLAEPGAIESLKDSLGDQMTVYPRGGHLGNLWWPETQAEALSFFRSDLHLARK